MNSVIRFSGTQKPVGKEYKNVTYWNRFIRTKTETLVMAVMVIFSLAFGFYKLSNETMDLAWAIILLILIFYPFMVITQFNASIRYHLKHRDPAESAPCEFCLMKNGILIDVAEPEVHTMIRYDELTHVYTNVHGFYMFFIKDKVVAMFRHSDIPDGKDKEFEQMLMEGISPKCKVRKFF